MFKNAIAAVALTAAVAQPAAAGNDDLIKLLTGVIVGAALMDTLNDDRPTHNNNGHDSYNRNYQEPAWDGHIQNRRNYPNAPQVCSSHYDDHGSFVDVYHYDCRGRILRVDTYHK